MPHDARKIALLLLLAGALGGCQRPADEPAKREAAPPPAEVKHEAPPPPQSPIARARADRDAQVWDGEVAAQDHERAFIDLWDRLRAADAPHEVLASFPVGQLLLGTPGPQDTMEDGLVRWSTLGDGERLDQAGFQAWIAARVAEGWALEQSEWHHSRFTPAQGDAPARSEVSFLLHARSGARRLDVHGTLQVKWAAEPGARGYHEPIEIDARELNMVERTGPEAFAAAIVEDPFPPQQNSRVIQPLIAHDLDGDGLSELIAVGANLVWRNRSEPGTIRLAPPEPLITPVRGTAGGGLVADVTGDGLVDLVRVVYGDAVYVHRGVKGGGFAPAEAPAVTLPEPLLAGLAITAGDIDGDRD
ncbi:MAG: VCBS repeat-containing protein, partial [Myxococcales bacterium]|nr:VCBS repeat-containing protein [Myxococcales bacterium]